MVTNGPRRLQRSFVRGNAVVLCLLAFIHAQFWVHAQDVSETSTGRQPPNSIFHEDSVEDSLFDPIAADPSCKTENECMTPPASTVETETILDATCFKGGDDFSDLDDEAIDSTSSDEQCTTHERIVDKHWGADPALKSMREQLQKQAQNPLEDSRPPIFLLPGLASTRLVAWKLKKCAGMFGTEIKVQDNVWLNINLVIQMGTVNVQCMTECLRLGLNQSDTDDWNVGCKLRPDEGLDAIASLAPGGIGSSLLVGGTNTVYSWLIQWLADNLGYDVTNIIGLPYDWRLSPDKMEARDGFLSMTRRRIEAAVASNGGLPGIMVAHSMGNLVFRYFLDWLRVEMREEAYQEYRTRARRREERRKKAEIKKLDDEQINQEERRQQQQMDYQDSQPHLDSPSLESTESPSEELDSPSSLLPGWVAAVPGFDNLLGWFASQLLQADSKIHDSEMDGLDQDTSKRTSHEEKQVEGNDNLSYDDDEARDAQFRELAIEEGDAKWLEWLEKHIWTYIGLSAPLLGAVNPLRAVISGENMGLPINDEMARYMEVSKFTAEIW